jgi:RNA polymerase-associated protein RTF1
MPEIEREEVLAQRLEEMQRIQDKRNLDQMLKAQKERSGEGDSVSKAAKRVCVLRVVGYTDRLWYCRTACSARRY